MKRKYDEGYALVFTLVVVLFLSIVAMFMLQITGDDLEAQQASISRMKDQYAAQGELEKIKAQLEAATSAEDLAAVCNQYGDENVGDPLLDGTADYIVTVHLEHPGSKYLVTIDCDMKAMHDPIGNRYVVEYTSYSISSTEIPRTQVPASENGGAQG